MPLPSEELGWLGISVKRLALDPTLDMRSRSATLTSAMLIGVVLRSCCSGGDGVVPRALHGLLGRTDASLGAYDGRPRCVLQPGETGTAETNGAVPNGDSGSDVAWLGAEKGGFGCCRSDSAEDSAVPAVAYMEVRPVAVRETPAVEGPPRAVVKAVERAV